MVQCQDMESCLKKTFPIKLFQMTKHQTELKRFDHGCFQWPSIWRAKVRPTFSGMRCSCKCPWQGRNHIFSRRCLRPTKYFCTPNHRAWLFCLSSSPCLELPKEITWKQCGGCKIGNSKYESFYLIGPTNKIFGSNWFDFGYVIVAFHVWSPLWPLALSWNGTLRPFNARRRPQVFFIFFRKHGHVREDNAIPSVIVIRLKWYCPCSGGSMFIRNSDVSNAWISSTINGKDGKKKELRKFWRFPKMNQMFLLCTKQNQMENLTYRLEVAILPLALNSHPDENLCHY